jgi:hypothetical protein
MLEYGSITSVFKDPTLGAQLCHVKGNLTAAEYQNCEILTPKWLNYMPKIWDTVVVSEMNNSEIAVFGVLDQFDLWLSEGETLLHGWTVSQWQSPSYNMKTSVKLNKNNEVVIQTADNGTPKATITVKPNWEVSIVNLWKTTIQSATEIELIAPVVQVI